MSPKSDTQKSTGFSAEEKAAMRQYLKEKKAEARAEEDRAAGVSAVLAAIAEMTGTDRALGERLHAIITTSAPTLAPRTWYGMPAYYKDGKNICFFQPAQKFKARYMTLGFNDSARLDEGHMWPVAFAVTEITPAEESKIAALVKKAVS